MECAFVDVSLVLRRRLSADALRIVHLALGGCLRSLPVPYGLTADTGGHIAYVLAAAEAQSRIESVSEIIIVTRMFDDVRLGGVYAVENEQIALKIRIVRIPTRHRGYLEKEALTAELPSFTEAFLDWLARERSLPSAIHAHFSDAAMIALAARERFGVPFVYTPHALGLDKVAVSGGRPSGREHAETAAIGMADAIVVSSRDEAERQISAYGVLDCVARTHIVAPGVPIACRGESLVGDLGDYFGDPARPLILAIARPAVKKNLVGVAAAFVESRLRETCNLLVLAGQHETGVEHDEQRAVLSQLRRVLKGPLAERCAALPSRHSSADVWALYRLAATLGGVFVSPALHEPFGLTLLEAAAAGLPVVATKHGGAADIVDTIGHGLLVDPRDHHAIAAACLRVVEDGRLRTTLVDACKNHLAHYCWDHYARQCCEVYAAAARSASRRDAVAA